MRTLTYLRVFWIVIKSASWTSLGFGTSLVPVQGDGRQPAFFPPFRGDRASVSSWPKKRPSILAMHYVRRRGHNYRSLLIVGTGRRATEFIRGSRRHPEWGFHILGAIDDEPGRGIKRVDGVEIIGTLDDIPKILHNEAVDEIVFVVPRSRLSLVEGRSMTVRPKVS